MRHGFWPLALLWLPAGFAVQAAVRFELSGEPAMWLAAAAQSLVVAMPLGVPLALGCRWLWRLGHRGAAWTAGFGLAAVTVAAGLFAGLLGPLALAACAAVLSLPVWIACFWLARGN